ncbi:hypothetical protein MMC07_007572 [Pseudocyphellaria aurata]|nr:hypothetical protein [Pseudocyphellaria aurata]
MPSYINESGKVVEREYEVDDNGQTSLLPPIYSHAIAREAHTPPKAEKSSSGDTADINDDVNDRCVQFVSELDPELDPENPGEMWQWPKRSSTNGRKVAKLSKFVLLLLTFGLLIHTVRLIHQTNEEKSDFDKGLSQVRCSVNKMCPGSTHKRNATYEFSDPSQFSLIQKVQAAGNYPYNYVRTEGTIHVEPETKHLDAKLRVEITVHASDPELMHLESLEETDSALVIKTLNGSRGFLRSKPCIYIDATVFVAPGTVLQNLGIDTQSFAIKFHPGLDYTVTDSVTLSTISGNIRMPIARSELLTTTRTREIIIHSSSGSVYGAYPLYDLLSITTLSGDIDISYFPKNTSSSNPQPASLELGSQSGNIHVASPVVHSQQHIPDRNYKNDLRTLSGPITASLLHSSHTSLRVASGNVDADIHPYGDLSVPSHLSTDSQSGSTTVTVRESLSHPSSPMRAFSASHRYVSGSLNLFYPAQWQGRILGDTVSGGLSIRWDGVTVIKDHEKFSGGRKIEAQRGEAGGEARLEFGGVSGRARLMGQSEIARGDDFSGGFWDD